ncbi:hypothetical protein ABZ892_15890 [Streptomyces sp. NPDC046924]|uniref:hypothetical protein n=1 Tax=Streptomyces sp. NPDC046924 TaxID=3155136 RepID=UPI0033DA3B56
MPAPCGTSAAGPRPGESRATPTAVPADHERTAVQACLRLLHTVRAAHDAESGPPETRRLPVVVPSVLAESQAEAETTLTRAGSGRVGPTGTAEAFFRVLRDQTPGAVTEKA